MVALALTVAACGASEDQSPNTTEPAVTTPEADPTTTLPLVAGCDEGVEFVEGGDISLIEQERSDSTWIGTVSWTAEPACETFTIGFSTSEGAPPTTPPRVSATYIGEAPIIRIHMDVEGTAITDQLVETQLVERLYVVRRLDGGMFLDLHLAGPTQARIDVSSSPARLTVDLQPGIVDYPTKPAVNELVVLPIPLDDSAVDSPTVRIEGYARTFEADVLTIVTQGDQLVAETVTKAADYTETWGEFRTSIDLDPGDYSLFVGEESPEDGSLQGVTIDLQVR